MEKARIGLGPTLLLLLALCARPTAAADPEPTPTPPAAEPAREKPAGDAAGEDGEEEEDPNRAEIEEPLRPRYIIEAIEVRGNDKTRGDLIISTMFLKPGESLDEEKVELSRIRLLALGYFKDVRMRLERGTQRGRVKLIVEVEERNTILIDDLFLGSSKTHSFWGGLGISDINFLGHGLVLSGAGVASKDQQALRLGVFWPSILNSNFQVGISTLISFGSEKALRENIRESPGQPTCGRLTLEDQAFKVFRGGGVLTGGVRVDRVHRLLIDYRFEVIDSDLDEPLDADGNNCSNYPFVDYLQGGSSFLSSLTLRFERDTRDDFFLPTHGMLLTVSVELASQVLGSSYEYSKYMLRYEQSFPAFRDHALRLSLAGGLIQDVGKRGSPYFIRFFFGDHALYWVDKGSLPRNLELNFSEVIDYGDVLASFMAEYDVPLWSAGSFFYRGYIYLAANYTYVTKASFLATEEEWSGRAKNQFTMDLGLKVDSPVGLFTLSLGYLVDTIW